MNAQDTTTRLEKLGLTAAAKILDQTRSMQERMTVAYDAFRFVEPAQIQAFNDKLREDTWHEDKSARSYKTLAFTPLMDYGKIPPEAALVALESAMDLGCFDTFEVATIEWVRIVKDPIIFGRIHGCEDRFFICQWDDDVKIEDILQGDEGYVKAGQ